MGLSENLQQETVDRLALRKPVVGIATDTVEDLVQRMREAKLGCAVIVDDDRKPIGMLTESMLREILLHKPESLLETVAKHMSDRWPWVRLSDPVADVLEAMELKNVRFLCVVDEEDRLHSLTGQKCLMEYVADHFPSQVMVQRVGSVPTLHEREGA